MITGVRNTGQKSLRLFMFSLPTTPLGPGAFLGFTVLSMRLTQCSSTSGEEVGSGCCGHMDGIPLPQVTPLQSGKETVKLLCHVRVAIHWFVTGLVIGEVLYLLVLYCCCVGGPLFSFCSWSHLRQRNYGLSSWQINYILTASCTTTSSPPPTCLKCMRIWL